MALKLAIPSRALLVLCGPAASGKSTFAAQRFVPTAIVSSDHCRAMICDDETNQKVHRETFDLFHYIIQKRIGLGRFTITDSTALQPFARRRQLEQAHRSGYAACLLIFNTSPETCLARDLLRERSVGEAVNQYHADLLQKTLLLAPNEGWDQLFVLDEHEIEQAEVEIIAPLT